MLEKSRGILFYLKKSKEYKSGPVEIYLSITVDGVPKELSTKVSCLPSKWNAKAGRATGTTEESRSINSTLDAYFVKVRNARAKLMEIGADITALAIRDMVSGVQLRERTILKLSHGHNEQMEALVKKEEFAASTLEMYEVAYGHAQEFIKLRYKVDDLNIRSLDFDFVESYYNWLKISKSQCHNTAIKNIGALKKQVLSCQKRGWLQNDPFALFPMTEEEVDTIFLWPEELERIMKKQFLSDRVSTVRDMFVFCCFTSLAFVDVKRLKRTDIVKGVDGEWWIMKKRQKTNEPIPVPLLPIAQKILDKYKDHPKCVANEVALAILSNQKYNEYLKEIAALCEINKELTTHVARHTFATTVAITNGLSLETTREVMGHADIKQTQHYGKILHIKVSQDMKKLKNRLNKSSLLKMVE
jgi:site-specific recombinase XerD